MDEQQFILYLRNKGYSEEDIISLIQMNKEFALQNAYNKPAELIPSNRMSVGKSSMDILEGTKNITPAPASFMSKAKSFGHKMGGASDLIGMGTELGSAAMSMGFARDGKLTDKEAGLSSAVKWGGRGLQIGANPALMAATGGLSAPIGAAVGVIGGAIGGGIHNRNMRNKDSAFQTDMLQQGKANMLDMYKAKAPSALPNVYQKNGVNSYGSYAYGGKTNSSYEVEGGEVMMQTGNQKPMALNGGYMNSISPTMQEIKGRSHKNGGVNAINDGFVFSNRLKTDNSKYLKRL